VLVSAGDVDASSGRPVNSDAATTVAALLRARVGDDALGVVQDDRRWAWEDVVSTSSAWADALVAARRPGPFHVAVLMENTPEYLFALFGCALAGATAVGLNPTRRGDELARDVRHTDVQRVLTGAALAPLLDGLDVGVAEVVRVDADAWPGSTGPGGSGPPTSPGPTVTPDDTFVLIFTSGSTGAPKAVRMSHQRAARAAAAGSWVGRDDVLYCAMPLFHGNALNAIVLPALGCGATIALRARFSASAFMPDVRRYGATFFTTVGRALAHVLATPVSPDDRDHRVRFALAPESSPVDVRAFRDRFGIHCVTGYGSSENAIMMVPVPRMPADALGVPQEGIDAAVVDPATGEERPRAHFDANGRLVNAGEAIGEIVGRNVVDRFEGYYGNPDAEAERTRGGWYWSGDLGYVDADGVFYFAGRTGERLRVDSENLAPAPVERILGRFPGVAGVAVYAVPDERTADDQVMAALEMAPDRPFDADAFARFLGDQPDMGTKWAPRFVRLTRLPVGGTGKVDKMALRADRWATDDPVFWRPGRDAAYRLFTAEDRAALDERLRAAGRTVDRV